jgi:hypothetical protein
MGDSLQPNAKVLFRVPNEDGSADVETLWATHVGGDNYLIEQKATWEHADPTYATLFPEDV